MLVACEERWRISPRLSMPLTFIPHDHMVVGVYGVTLFDAADAEEVPTELVAVTVKVYGVPLVRPVTVAKVPLVVAVIPPGLEVTRSEEHTSELQSHVN